MGCGLAASTTLAGVELVSPASSAIIDSDRPMLFWKNVQGAERFTVTIDDDKPIEVTASPSEVSHLSVPTALAGGEHKWSVRTLGQGEDVAAGRFTVEIKKQWPAWAIGPFLRYAGNPLLTPTSNEWEGRNAYNPGVMFDNGMFRMLYRGQAATMRSQIGYAESADGITFKRDATPLIPATEPYEGTYGNEDPRLYKLDDTYYTFITGNVPGTRKIALCEATSKDGRNWTKLGIIETGTKNGAVLCDAHATPVKVNGKYVMYIGDQKMGVCYSDDMLKWGPITWIDMGFPKGWTKPYEPCYAVTNLPGRPDDVVLFIAGRLNGKNRWYYAISEYLFKKADLDHPADKLDDCILKPAEPYESGEFKNCLWMNSIIEHDGQWWMYYGAGDRNIGLATAAAK